MRIIAFCDGVASLCRADMLDDGALMGAQGSRIDLPSLTAQDMPHRHPDGAFTSYDRAWRISAAEWDAYRRLDEERSV